jgi:hypothetical protein
MGRDRGYRTTLAIGIRGYDKAQEIGIRVTTENWWQNLPSPVYAVA